MIYDTSRFDDKFSDFSLKNVEASIVSEIRKAFSSQIFISYLLSSLAGTSSMTHCFV